MLPLHDRSDELSFLSKEFKQRPTAITVILGPQNSGKTKLIKTFFDTNGQFSLFGSYLDARAAELSDPRQSAASLFDPHWSRAASLGKLGQNVVDAAGQLQIKEGAVKVGIQSDLGRLYNTLTKQRVEGQGLDLQVATAVFMAMRRMPDFAEPGMHCNLPFCNFKDLRRLAEMLLGDNYGQVFQAHKSLHSCLVCVEG